MHFLDLPQDAISSILEYLYEHPKQNSDNALPLTAKRWSEPKNKTIYVLSRVCKALAEYTHPLRFRYVLCASPIDLLLFVNILKRNETLQQSVRFLFLSYRSIAPFVQAPYFLDTFPKLFPNLFALQITIQGNIDQAFIDRLARCVNLRHLTLSCSEITSASVPTLASLNLWSLQVHLYNQSPYEAFPIKAILSGQSRFSLKELHLSCFVSSINRYHLKTSMVFPSSTTLRGLKALSLQDAVLIEKDTLTKLSHFVPNLETLSVQLRAAKAVDPDASGSWPELKRLYVDYKSLDNTNVQLDRILFNAPSLTEVFLDKLSQSAFFLLCREIGSPGFTQIRFLTIEIVLMQTIVLSSKQIRNLSSCLESLEALTLKAYNKGGNTRMEKKMKLQNIEACTQAFSGEITHL